MELASSVFLFGLINSGGMYLFILMFIYLSAAVISAAVYIYMMYR